MKGVILAGGKGSRLYPLTRVTNKHLLPVYDRPMIFYPMQTLVDAGICEIIVVTGGQNAGDFLRLLSNGHDFGLKRIHYTYQEGEGGIADALRLAEPFVEGEKICVILGDNIIENNIIGPKAAFEKQSHGAHLILKEVKDPKRFGCPEMSGGNILTIEEKPNEPRTAAGHPFLTERGAAWSRFTLFISPTVITIQPTNSGLPRGIAYGRGTQQNDLMRILIIGSSGLLGSAL
jgi:glucose-1-phosphate thymidylyltransferase